MSSASRTAIHRKLHRERIARLESGVYGTIHAFVPATPEPVLCDPPGYLDSEKAMKTHRFMVRAGLDPEAPRCFYSGCRTFLQDPKNPIVYFDPRKIPWLGTKDHLVPARRALACEFRPQRVPNAMVWSSYVVNATLGLAPMLVKLKIREWLRTARIDRSDMSLAAGNNLRWLIIEMLDDFRIEGRFPWSRRGDGTFWNEGISRPFMRRMIEAEDAFLALGQRDRDAFVKAFDWRF